MDQTSDTRLDHVSEQMRRDWNARAREDAGYYVAFGRHQQDDEEFFSTAAEVVHGLEWELMRIPTGADRGSWKALEVGCGPGRLMKPMSRHFAEIHGVDVSDEMVRLAREKLRGIPHAHVHTSSSGADLAAFASESFEFVYSYAVFQHIPSREVVFSYLREIHRVLKVGGLVRCQLNGLPQTAAHYDTWSGVRISADEVKQFTREHDLQLLTLEGVQTQYMWTTWRKMPRGWRPSPGSDARIRRITNAANSEPVAPPHGRFSAITLLVEKLPLDCDLNYLEVRVGGLAGTITYLGRVENDGLQQLNVILAPLSQTGLVPVEVRWLGQPISNGTLRVIPAGPRLPRILSVADGVDALSGTRVVTRSVKVTLEEADSVERFEAWIDGQAALEIEVFCADPQPPRYEINFRLPNSIGPGAHEVTMRLGERRFAPVVIEVAER